MKIIYFSETIAAYDLKVVTVLKILAQKLLIRAVSMSTLRFLSTRDQGHL